MDGRDKFYQDMLGTRAPLETEKKILDDAADRIHAENVRLNAKDKERIEQFHVDDDAQRLQRQLNARAKIKPVEKKTPRKPTLDEIDVEAKVQKETEAEQARQRSWQEMEDYLYRYPPNWQLEEAKQRALNYARENPDMKNIIVPMALGTSYEFRVHRSPAGTIEVELIEAKEKVR